MLVRSRSARFAALALAVTTPLVASFAAPAFADGSDADVTATINADGDVEVTSSKGLSRTTVVLCNGSVVVVPSWSGDVTTGEVDVDGAVRAVFVHSGDNTTDEAIALLELLSPGASNGSSTGEIAFDESCEVAEDDDDDDSDDDTTVTPADPGDPGPETTTAAPSTNVLGVTLEQTSTPAPAPATAPVVDSNTLPRTGAGVQFLVTLALSLLAAGITLRATFTRRIRSASFPG